MNWTKEKAEVETISAIAKRWKHLSGIPVIQTMMCLEGVHANGCPLNLSALLNAPDPDFSHDLSGIWRNFNKNTGALDNCFLPRYAKAG